MNTKTVFRVLVLAAACFSGLAADWAAADTEVTATLEPVREIFVSGDKEKFRAQHWMKDNYTGGLKDFSLKSTLADGTEITSAAHALIDQNDLGAAFSVRKRQLGFITFDYSEFRKYYDGTGGLYNQFTTLAFNDTDRQLALDIGKLSVETGMTIEGWPELSFQYERAFKDGTKSWLAWTPVTQGTVAKNIGPSWQDIDEVVDSFNLKASHEVAGFGLEGQQRWEFARTETFREERSLSTNTSAATASERKIRRQDQAPQSILMTTTLGTQRQFLEEKVFFSSGYHFNHMKNREFESLLEFDENGNPKNFSNPKQQVNARADNTYDTHAWVSNMVYSPWGWLHLGTKLKSEVINRESNSTYPADSTPVSSTGSTPNGVIDRFDNSETDSKATRWGEALSLRMTAIPKTALYTELELEQGRVVLREDRQSIDGPDSGNGVSTGEIFNRRTVTLVNRGSWTAGGQFAPWGFLNFTTQVRHRINNNDYDDQVESAVAPGSTARSAFIDGQSIHTDEFTTRLTFHPCQWFRSSLRYQFRDDKYSTHVEAQQLVKTGMRSHIYTYDVTLQPLRELTATASFSRQTAATWTPAASSAAAKTPGFDANVNYWLFALDYAPHPKVTLTGTMGYSRAFNFNDFSASGLPLGADYVSVDLVTGVQFAVTDNVSVGADYGYYHYQPNNSADTGRYDAHAVSFRTTYKF